MNKSVSLLDLPNEILHNCAWYLNLCDLVSLSQTCQRLRLVCCLLNRSINCHEEYDINPSSLQLYFKTCVNPSLVTYCDFSHCYWIPRSLLGTVIKKLTNLEVLYVAETQLRCRDISEILTKCHKVRHLSLSVPNAEDFWIEKPTYGIPVRIGENRTSRCFMEACRSCLTNLKELQVYNCFLLDALSALLRLCPELEDLRLLFFSVPGKELPHRSHCPPDNLLKLKSLTVLLTREDSADDLFMLSLQLYFTELVRKLRELRRCWFHMPMAYNCGRSTFEFAAPLHQFEMFCNPWLSTTDFTFNRDILESIAAVDGVRVPDGGFHRLRHLTMLSVDRDLSEQPVVDLVQSSRVLELLDLRGETVSASLWSENTRNLRVLNLSASVFTGFLDIIVKNCPLIEDLTLTSRVISGPFPDVQDSELARVAAFPRLTRLSLELLHVRTGNFLAAILKKCKQLESLTLRDIGPSGLCCYSNQLTVNIAAAQKLNHLLISQKNVVLVPKLLDALENCKALRQLGLVLPSNADPFKLTQDNFRKRMHRLVSKLPNLVALHCLFSIPKVHCVKTTAFLRESFFQERPAFFVLLQMSMSWRSLSVPVVHRKIFFPEESSEIVCPNSVCK